MTKYPALFAPVWPEWIEEAFDYFVNGGKSKLYFFSDSNIGCPPFGIKKVYLKPKGQNLITTVADFIEITEDNPREFRLPGCENEEGKFYYGFKNIIQLKRTIPLTSLRYYNTGNNLRNSCPGAKFIIDPIGEGKR